jgi:hypothetical protein
VYLPTVRDTGKYKIVMFSHYPPLAFPQEAVRYTGVGTGASSLYPGRGKTRERVYCRELMRLIAFPSPFRVALYGCHFFSSGRERTFAGQFPGTSAMHIPNTIRNDTPCDENFSPAIEMIRLTGGSHIISKEE